jgi:hypothetical protein
MNRELTEVYRGYNIYIEQDESPESPREWDNAGIMVCWHRNYNLGDQQPKQTPQEWLANFIEANPTVKAVVKSIYRRYRKTHQWPWHGEYQPYEFSEIMDEMDWQVTDMTDILNACGYVFLGVWMYEHSGIALSAQSFRGRAQHAEWDSSQLGLVYCPPETVAKEWGTGPDARSKAEACLKAEVEVYGQYVNGDVYGYMVENLHDDTDQDSCWGYYGYQDCISEALYSADYLADHYAEKIASEQERELEFAY